MMKKTTHFCKVTAENAFLEHPGVILRIRRYLASVEVEGRGGSAGGDDEQHVGSRCLDCLESIREYQKADMTEHRQELWAIIRRRVSCVHSVFLSPLESNFNLEQLSSNFPTQTAILSR